MLILLGMKKENIDFLLKKYSSIGDKIKIRTGNKLSSAEKNINVLRQCDPLFKKLEPSLKKGNVENLVIILSAEDEKLSNESGNCLYLPENIDDKLLCGITTWLIRYRKKNLCFELFKSFFQGGDIQILLTDKDGKILSCIPVKTNFLGYTSKDLKNKYFKEVFGISVEDIPFTESNEDHIRYLTNASNKETSCNVSRMPISSMKIPGLPARTEWILLLTEISEIKKLEDKSSRLNVIQDNILRERTIELESANEILQKQALELKHAMEELEKKNRQIVEELSLASELQKSLLPKEFPSDLPLNFAHKYIPYAYIGGDFFDVKRLDKSRVGIVIADVSGHGVSSAFITTMFKSQFDNIAADSKTPAETLSRLNKEFSNSIHTEHYITAFYSVIDTETMKMYYSNAGHPNQLLFRENSEVLELSTMGFFLGMFEGTEYEDKEIDLLPGDRILYNTDGILETANEEGKQFGKEGVIRIFRENLDKDIDDLSNMILSELVMFMAETTFQDDITILITEVIENL